MDADDLMWAYEVVRKAAGKAEGMHENGDRQMPFPMQTREWDFRETLGRAMPVIERLVPDKYEEVRNWGTYVSLYRMLYEIAGTIEVMAEVESRFGSEGPQLKAGDLHPLVWGAAATLWDTEHYAEAVLNAGRAVNADLQTRLGRRDISETDLVQQAFSLDPPKPGSPRLRFCDVDEDDEPKTWRSRHQGAMHFGTGLFMGIRNVIDHADPADEIDPEEALEFLAAWAVLAGWLDCCERQGVEEPGV